jgi:uroporphyrinogen-III synthase
MSVAMRMIADPGPRRVPETVPKPQRLRDTGFAGARIGLLEGRMGRELADLVRRQHGTPVVAPALREVPLDASAEVQILVDGLIDGSIDMVIFLTGAGANALFAEAVRIGRSRELEDALRWVTTVCRGHKPRAAMKQKGLPVSVMVAEPYTTADVIEALAGLSPEGRGVAIIHYGERSPVIAEALSAWGSRVQDVCVYEWSLPEDTGPLERLIDEILAGRIDAVAFTSQIQVRHIFEVAGRNGTALGLMQALNTRTVVAAVGPTCAEALRAVGVPPLVVPSNPKMGPMVMALVQHLRAVRGRQLAPRE